MEEGGDLASNPSVLTLEDYKITAGDWPLSKQFLKWPIKFGPVGTKLYGWPTRY